jgi:hypothetical protein
MNRLQLICLIALLAQAAAPAVATEAANSTSYIFREYGPAVLILDEEIDPPQVLASLEFLLQSDKSTYLPGEPVDLLFRITNQGPNPIAWYLWPHHPLTISQGGDRVWSLGGGILLMGGTNLFQLGVGEVHEIHAIWDMTDDSGAAILPGIYEINATPSPELFSLVITVVPEPSTIVSLLAGGILLVARQRRAHRYNLGQP